jgi:hypothetical protein
MDAKAPERRYLWGRSPLLTESSPLNGDRPRLRHYVLRYRGRGPAPAEDVARIVGAVHVLDHVSRMLLVEGSASQMASLAVELPSWVVREERAFVLGRASMGVSDHDVASSQENSAGIDSDLTGGRRQTG